MKTLILVRHGEFVRGDPFVPNIGCPMTRDGKREVGEAAARFAGLGIRPDLILTSPARRAGETAEIFAKKLGTPSKKIRVEKELFEAEKREILRIVHQLDDSLSAVMLVGHNPAVTDLLHHLVSADVYNLKLSASAVLTLSVDRWRDANFGKAELANFDEPEVKLPQITWRDRLEHWRREHIQKIELFFVFLIGLLVILGIVALVIQLNGDPAGPPVK